MSEDLISLDARKKAFEYYCDVVLPAAEVLTGIVGTNPTQLFTSVGHVIQGALKDKHFHSLSREFKKYREKGRIKEEFVNSDANQMYLAELLRFLEQDIPDPQRFELLKKIYIVAATEEKSDKDSPLPLQFMQLARSLSAGELLILFCAFRHKSEGIQSRDKLIDMLTSKTGLKYRQLVIRYFDELVSKGLLRNPTGYYSDAEPILKFIEHFALAFCEYVEQYDLLKTEQEE
jgi:hypothetical protein